MRSLRTARLAAALAIPAALACLPAGAAQDIDIFAGGSGPITPPNVLIAIDNSANWNASLGPNACNPGNTKFDAEVCALSTAVGGLSDGSVRLGLMMFNESGNNGAYVRFGMRDVNAQNKAAFSRLVSNMLRQGSGTDNSGANQPYGKTVFEAFKYFGGYTSPAHATDDVPGSPVSSTAFGTESFNGGSANSSGTFRRDYRTNTSGTPTDATGVRSAVVNGADSNSPFRNQSDNTYSQSPINNACAKNFLIVISNGNPGTGGDSSAPDARTLLGNVGGDTNPIRQGSTEIHASTFDEWTRFLYKTDVSPLPGQQKVITYTIAVYQPQPNGSISNTDQEMIKLMKSAANVGGGKYFAATNAAEIVNAIKTILNEVQAVNSVFVSASLPVSVNTQGTYLNQVYMGMFRPDGSGNPRWMGNLKQYQFVLDSTTGFLYLADSLGNRAVNTVTGFVSPAAVSFWTTSSSFWINDPTGTPASGSDSPDGEVVEKGGAAEGLREDFATSQATRRVFTCPAGGCAVGPLTYEFNTTNVTGAAAQTAFGASDATELAFLVNWIRGQDNANGDPAVTGWTSAERGPGLPTTVRPSIHGDVLHSRPVVLNYTGLGPYIFYGANDGLLRGVKGGQAADGGHESWSFLAPEFYRRLKRLRDASPQLLTPRTPSGITPPPQTKDYFFDGPIGSYQDSTKAWIFAAARRGGSIIYAFDVSDPRNPQFMWKKTRLDLPELGQTWSEPKAIRVRGSADPILIFGAGYDPGEDQIPPVNNGVGRGIYILNARTGAELAFLRNASNGAAISHPVPSDVAVVDTDFDTYVDRAYVGDVGGNVWRIDLNASTPAGWRLFKLATVSNSPVMKFFYQPDVVLSNEYATVLVGSGDREKPLLGTTSDRFFGLRDRFNGFDATGMVAIQPSEIVLAASPLDATTKGWYLQLLAGEKVVNSPLTVAGITYFSTNQPTPPAPDTCTSNLGLAKSYALDFLTGTAGLDRDGDGRKTSDDLFVPLSGGGLPPSPVGGIVQLADGKLVGFLIGGGSSSSPIEAGRITVRIPKTRQKVYWNSNTDK